jgi:hypothetical protein
MQIQDQTTRFLSPTILQSSVFVDQVEGKVPCYNPIELHLGKIDAKVGKWQGMGKKGTKFGSQIQHHTTRDAILIIEASITLPPNINMA